MSARRWWAWPLVPLYAAAQMVKDGLRVVGLLKVKRLGWPVVSVGSISAGGAGKTPVVIALARLLLERGWVVDVLSRGHGREGNGIERVAGVGAAQVPFGNDNQKNNDKDEKQILRFAQDDNFSGKNNFTQTDEEAKRFGDEPVLIARAAGVPVWVGADRFAAGELAEKFVAREREADLSAALGDDNKKGTGDDDKKSEVDDKSGGDGFGRDRDKSVHILDDGFQHRRLKRDVDIVLVTAEDFEDALLPAGNRREPLGALGRADVVVVREEERANVEAQVIALMRDGALLWSVRRSLRFPAPLGVLSAGLRPLAFCAIARPEGFAMMLQGAGCGVIDTVVFDDHHPFTMSDVEQIIAIAKRLNASGFVTTEKDAVKLSTAHRALLESVGPVMIVALDVAFVDAPEVWRALEARLA